MKRERITGIVLLVLVCSFGLLVLGCGFDGQASVVIDPIRDLDASEITDAIFADVTGTIDLNGDGAPDLAVSRLEVIASNMKARDLCESLVNPEGVKFPDTIFSFVTSVEKIESGATPSGFASGEVLEEADSSQNISFTTALEVIDQVNDTLLLQAFTDRTETFTIEEITSGERLSGSLSGVFVRDFSQGTPLTINSALSAEFQNITFCQNLADQLQEDISGQ